MTKHSITAFEPGGGWLPAAAKPISQQLIGVRAMPPHGDRRDRAESGCIEAQKRGPERDDDVVRVFVLSDDFGDLNARRLRSSPAQQVAECAVIAERLLNLSDQTCVGCIDWVDRNRPHEEPYEPSIM